MENKKRKIEIDEHGLAFYVGMTCQNKIAWIKKEIERLKKRNEDIEMHKYKRDLTVDERTDLIIETRRNTDEIKEYEKDIIYYEKQILRQGGQNE